MEEVIVSCARGSFLDLLQTEWGASGRELSMLVLVMFTFWITVLLIEAFMVAVCVCDVRNVTVVIE